MFSRSQSYGPQKTCDLASAMRIPAKLGINVDIASVRHLHSL